MKFVVDTQSFWNHLCDFFTNLEKYPDIWSNSNSLIIIAGATDENVVYRKTNAIQLWLFGYELANTILLFAFSSKTLYVITSKKVCSIFAELGTSNNDVFLKFIQKDKTDDFKGNKATIIDLMQKAGRTTALLTKESCLGKFSNDVLSLVKEKFEIVEAHSIIAELLAVKSQKEQEIVKDAARLSSAVMKNYLISEIETIVDEDKNITHSVLAENTEDVFTEPERVQIENLKKDSIESCYTPIIQSGGKYSLKPSAQSDDANLGYENGGTILISIGARYKSYCTNIARTLFFNPSGEQENVYKVLLKVFEVVKATLKNGTPLNKVWDAVIQTIRQKKPELENKFSKNCGFAMGLEFRESAFVINKGSKRTAKNGMVFNICVGFEKLVDQSKAQKGYENASKYACMISDTVLVTENEAEIVTHCSRKFQNVSYTFDESDNEEANGSKNKPTKSTDRVKPPEVLDGPAPMEVDQNGITDDIDPTSRGRTTRAQARSGDHAKKQQSLAKQELLRSNNQKELLAKKHEHALTRLSERSDGGYESDEEDSYVDPESYVSPENIPVSLPNKIQVDVANETVLVPITGCLIPFHISTIKNVHINESGAATFLRMNFVAPAAIGFSRLSLEKALLHHKNEMFIRELTFRSDSGRNLERVVQLIKDLKRQAAQRIKEKRDRDTLIVQEDIVLMRDKTSVPRLRDLKIKPVMGGKRAGTGILEAHINGFRYTNRANSARLDIIYSNIKHAFYQKATEKTISVVIHFHLKNPIMVGRKKTKDIQAYCEVVDTSQDIDMRGGWGDQDGLREEQKERQFRNKMNNMFRDFARRSEEIIAANKQIKRIQFDIPYEKLSFTGVPDKQSVVIHPTLHCLVALEDSPPFVLTLKDVEIANFERVQFHLRQFDLVFVFKDFKRVPLHISAIPMNHLEPLRQYLNDAGIVFFTGAVNLDWNRVMKHILSDLRGFYEEGGWTFLDSEAKSDAEDEDGAAHSEGASDEYNPTDDGGSSDVGSEDEEFDSASSEVSEGSASDEYEGSEEEEEEGLDWDDLEKEALADDRRTAQRDRMQDDHERARSSNTRQRR